MILYANTLFRVSRETLTSWEVSPQDLQIITKVGCYQIERQQIRFVQAQDNYAKAFNRFVRNHPQWKKAVSKKLDIEKMLVDIEESALIFSMYN